MDTSAHFSVEIESGHQSQFDEQRRPATLQTKCLRCNYGMGGFHYGEVVLFSLFSLTFEETVSLGQRGLPRNELGFFGSTLFGLELTGSDCGGLTME